MTGFERPGPEPENSGEISETAAGKNHAVAYGALPDTDLAIGTGSRPPMVCYAGWCKSLGMKKEAYKINASPF
jgi:hypothetical protein